MARGFTEAERHIVHSLIESKAVDFEALGTAFARHAGNATFQLDGEDFFCGTMRRFVRVMRLSDSLSPLEKLAELRNVTQEIQTGG